MIDTSVPLSPGWYLQRLMCKLDKQRTRLDLLDSYYDGSAFIAPLNPSKSVREAYRRLMGMARTNFAELVVEAVRERMNPLGFRTGADSDDLGDKEAWRIWQANELDADSGLVHRASLSMGDGYVIVGGLDPDIDAPVITAEDPRQVVTEHDPVRKRKVIAALKVFRDDVAALDKAVLYLPGYVWKAARRSSSLDGRDIPLSWESGDWDWVDQTPEEIKQTQLVPVVRFPNRADLAGRSKAEFEPHLAVLDRINYEVLQRLEISTMQAFRQRGIKGIPMLDESGNPIDYTDVFSADPGALWQLPETADIWESGQVDLSGIRDSIRHDVQDLAAVTRTPLFYLTPDAANGSAEGATLARESLVFKTLDRIVQAGESWEQVMSLAFTFAGDATRASRTDMETIWSSPQRYSMAEKYDAATKAQVAGVPWKTVMLTILEYTPQEVERMEEEKASDAMFMEAFATPRGAKVPLPGEIAPLVPQTVTPTTPTNPAQSPVPAK